MSTEVEETLRRIQSHRGVSAVMITNSQGVVIKSTLKQEESQEHAALVSQVSLPCSVKSLTAS